jgi:hypothetical protein
MWHLSDRRKMHAEIWRGKLRERHNLENLDGDIISKWIFKKNCGRRGLDRYGSECGQVAGLCENCKELLIIKSTTCTNFSNLFWIELYMFRTVPVSIIRSFSLYTQQWYMSYRVADRLRAGSEWNILILLANWQQTCTTGTIAVRTVKNS